jgi:hypothetical protein
VEQCKGLLASGEEKIDALVAELERLLANDIEMAAAADVRKGTAVGSKLMH